MKGLICSNWEAAARNRASSEISLSFLFSSQMTNQMFRPPHPFFPEQLPSQNVYSPHYIHSNSGRLRTNWSILSLRRKCKQSAFFPFCRHFVKSGLFLVVVINIPCQSYYFEWLHPAPHLAKNIIKYGCDRVGFMLESSEMDDLCSRPKSVCLTPLPPSPLRARFVRALDEKEPCHFNKDPPWNKTPLDILASPAATLPCLLGLFYIYILINAPVDLIVLIFPVHTWDKAELLPSCVDLPEILKNNFNCVRAFREKKKKTYPL